MTGGAVLAINLENSKTQEFLAALKTYFQNKGQKKESPNEAVTEVVENELPPPPPSNKICQ